MSTHTMENSCRVLALIPARGGSKGIPGKNLAPLDGRPLLAHAIANAKGCRRIDRVAVSTDSPAIAAEARRLGAEVPFLRPAELSGDESPMRDVVVHAFRFLADRGEAPEVIALFQPTSPFLRPETVERALDRLDSSGARLLKAVKRVREHPGWMLIRRGDSLEPFIEGPVRRRQDLPELFIPCGALYLYRAAYLEGPGDPEPCGWIELSWPESLDIDEPDDLALARWVVERRGSAARRQG
jgi:CMP-N,N'-diacetyllegionaminic acid synthase